MYAGDPTLLSMLLYNLTENAVKSCADGGRVLISCKKSENEVRIIVSDNGKGLTPEQLLRITEPFYRTDKARSRKDGGAGLGLALCKSIVECHGGRICFDSQPNSGTKVEVILQSECVCKEEQCNEK